MSRQKKKISHDLDVLSRSLFVMGLKTVDQSIIAILA